MLRIEAGSAVDSRTGEFVRLGLPYGEPVVNAEESMAAFARSLKIETNGHHLRMLKAQLARLASATIRMAIVEEGRAVQLNTQIVGAFDL